MARLLLVDDEVVLLAAISRILSDVGYETTTASSGRQALDALSAGLIPDLIITDVLMDDIDGLQLFATVRGDRATQVVPFIFVSASAKPELEARIAGSPNAIFIRKPFEIEELLVRIAHMLGQSAP